MKKGILLGPGPNIEEDLEKINFSKYDGIFGINNVYHPKFSNLLFKYNINPINFSIYFISEYYYRQIEPVVDSFGFKKIVFVIPSKLINKKSYKYEHCSKNITDKIQAIGGYTNGWPTSGMLAVGYLLENKLVEHITLAGFTFGLGNKLHYYNDQIISKHHIPSNELKIFNYYKELNKVNNEF